jgi:hypothetical protein
MPPSYHLVHHVVQLVIRPSLRMICMLSQSVYFLLRRAGEARRCSIESMQSFVIPDQHEEPL